MDRLWRDRTLGWGRRRQAWHAARQSGAFLSPSQFFPSVCVCWPPQNNACPVIAWTVTVSAVQPRWWRDKWSEVKDGHRITFTPPLFSQHVLTKSPVFFTQVTAPLWVLRRAASGSWESGTCNRRCSFWRSSIRRPKRSGFAGGRGAPSVCPATAAFPHLSVSDSALWVNGDLIPGVRSLIHRLLSLRCHSLARALI